MNQYSELQLLMEQLDKVMSLQEFDEDELDYGIVDQHVSFLRTLDTLRPGAISVFDMFKRQHVFVGAQYAKVFGWDLERAHQPGYGESRIHPKDLVQLMKAGVYFTRFAVSLPVDEKLDHKMYADYRVQGPDGEYMRVVEQQSGLQLDPRGNVWLALSVLDPSPYDDLVTSFRARLINHKTGDLYVFPPPDQNVADLLTQREKEILELVSRGLVSREIADTLYISVNTVNTHRQRIIKKLDVTSTTEAIRYAIDIGLLGEVG